MTPRHLDGVLVVDKPQGITSHDVVYRVRRALHTRKVGHAGTLDPMATGVLVVLVGRATKLSRFLTLDQKSYEAVIGFGTSTDTWDATGQVTERQAVPEHLLRSLAADTWNEDDPIEKALQAERERLEQVPPSFSAIKTHGVASYKRARKGETIDLPARPVRVNSLVRIDSSREPPTLHLRMLVSKGYYVRSLAHDLGTTLQTPTHLAELRRISSGAFGLDHAVTLPLDEDTAQQALIPLEDVLRMTLPSAMLTASGACRAVQGKQMSDDDFTTPPPEQGSCAWFLGEQIIAIGDRSKQRPTVRRALVDHEHVCS